MDLAVAAPSPSVNLQPGDNVWRIEHADRAATIIDADEYFRAARSAMLMAEQRIMLIGWDFDARIELGRSEEEPEAPSRLGDFILWLVNRKPGLHFYLLRWDLGAVKTLFRGSTIFTLMKWMRHPQITTRLDSNHPPGASHHQKIVVIDDGLAFCGGIDMTGDRWDTRDHLDGDPRRHRPNGAPYKPWHDATTALEGPVAGALGDLARRRWECAGGERLDPIKGYRDCWPPSLGPHFRDIDIAISRSRPTMPDLDSVYEIERLYLDLIAGAKRRIYAESQYFASRRIAEAIAKRIAEPDGPEIVLINPLTADGWLEPIAMDTARARLHEALRRIDQGKRFRIYHPYTVEGEPIYVHAKIMIVDDEILRVGSSNWNNRSMRLDTECDVTIDCRLPANSGCGPAIRSIRDSLLGEHLGVDPAEIGRRLDGGESLIATIEALRGEGRTLRPYKTDNLNEVETWLADNEILDPEGPEEMFESLTKRGLFRRFTMLRARYSARLAR